GESSGINKIQARATPDHEREDRDQERAATAEAAARHDRAQLVLTAAQKLLEIRRGRTRGLRTRPPGTLGTRAPGPAALIIPGHDMFSWVAGRAARTRFNIPAAVIGEPPPRFNAPRVAARSNVHQCREHRSRA